RSDRRRGRAPKHDADDLALEFAASWRDGQRSVADGELPRFAERRPLCVPEVIELVDELTVGERLAAAQLERTREDARQHAIAFPVQLPVNQPREADVVVPGREEQRNRRN